MWPGMPGCVAKFEWPVWPDEGQDLVEYAFVIALIALGVVASLKPMAVLLSTMFSNLAAAFVRILT
jgi:Flp pilus assembly pilin Flp